MKKQREKEEKERESNTMKRGRVGGSRTVKY